MARDPKQWLLLHVEKVVLVVMLLLLALVVSVYRPWSIEVPAKEEIWALKEKAETLMKEGGERKLPDLVPPDYRIRVEQVWREPWKGYRAPERRPLSTAAIWSPFNTILPGDDKRPIPLPPVLMAKRVIVKAERAEALIIFELDDFEENRQLQQLGVPEYQGGLEFQRIEILRINKATGEGTPITPPDWLPEGLPTRYGAPPRNLGAQLGFAEPVYLFAQRPAPGPGGPDEDRLRREMEDLRRQRDEIERRGRAEADRQEQERRRRAEEDRKRREEVDRRRTTTDTSKTPKTTTTPTPAPRPAPRKVRDSVRPGVVDSGPVKTPAGVYWFLDKGVKSGAEYEYRVVIYCKNPVYGTSKASPGMPPVLASKSSASTAAGVVFPSITKWYFQGGFVTQDVQRGTFRVRRFVGGRTGFSTEEITEALADFVRPEGEVKRPTKKPTVTDNASGLWVQQNFQVRPGEEIGRKATVDVNGEPREIDFATGCQLVLIRDEVSVVESVRDRLVPGKDAPKTVEDVRRIVNAVKLRCAYIGPQGGLETRWQESAPSLDKELMPQ